MRFCEVCNNMLYVTIDIVDEKKRLVHYCKTCGHRDIDMSNKSMLVLDDNKVSDTVKYNQYVNKFIKHDPCLPRVKNITCPHDKCTKAEDAENEVIYIKYDAINMKYVYYCCHCDHYWTNQEE